MADRTLEAVERQVRAMGADMFEIGLFKPADGVSGHPEMLPRVWSVEVLIKSVPWLKFQNSDGRNMTCTSENGWITTYAGMVPAACRLPAFARSEILGVDSFES